MFNRECLANGLKCTDMCKLPDCNNQPSTSDSEKSADEDEDEDKNELESDEIIIIIILFTLVLRY